MVLSCRLLICSCLLALPTLLGADFCRGCQASEEDLKSVLSQEPIDARQVLQALLGDSGRYRSGDREPQGFSVEIIGIDADNDEVRLIGDYSDAGFRSLEFHGQMSITFRHNQQMLRIKDKRYSLSDEGAVRVAWDTLSEANPTEECRIDVSIAGLLSSSDEWNSVEYDSGISQLRATNSKDETLIVCLRTPEDAEHQGSLISHAASVIMYEASRQRTATR